MARFRRKRHQLTAERILFGDWPAVEISGDSGMGKTEILKQLTSATAMAGVAAVFIDPPGDAVEDIEIYVSRLPSRVRHRVTLVRPSDLRHTVPINSLAVPSGRASVLKQRAWRAVKVEHTTAQLLAAWGELEQGVEGRPRLWKYTYQWLSTLAACGLAVPDVNHFFSPRSPVYRALSSRAPDIISRIDLAALSTMKPADAEELIASAKTRFQAFLSNPLVVAALSGGVAGIPAFDAYRAIQEGQIVLVHLGRGDNVLRDMDVQILANLWLSEFLFAAYSTPRHLRKHLVVFLDELHEFESSSALLTRLARYARKYKFRAICSHQGTQFFKERTESRLLNALVGQSGVRILFRHTNPADRRYFAEVLARPNPWAVKHVLSQQQQYQDGHDLATLIDTGDSWNDARQHGTSHAEGATEQSTDTTGTSEARQFLTHASRVAQRNVQATTQSAARGHADSRTDTTTDSLTESRGGSRTYRQVLVPRIRERKIITSVQFLTIDEQRVQEENTLAELSVGEAQVHVSGQRPQRVTFRLAPRPYAATPKFAAKKLAELRAVYFATSHYRNPAEVLAIRERFAQEFAEAILAQPAKQQAAPVQRRLPSSTSVTPAALPNEAPFAEGF
jgi:hypothetical protein